VKDDQVGMRALLSGEVDSFDTTTGGIAAASRGADPKFVAVPGWRSLCGAGAPRHHQDGRSQGQDHRRVVAGRRPIPCACLARGVQVPESGREVRRGRR